MGKQGPEWHSDGTSLFRRPIASQLYRLESNSVGGDTLYAYGAVAYETLAPRSVSAWTTWCVCTRAITCRGSGPSTISGRSS